MALGVATAHGRFSPQALALVTLAAVCLGAAAAAYRRHPSPEPADPFPGLVASLLVLLAAGVLDAPGHDLQHAAYWPVFVVLQTAFALALAAATLRPRDDRLWRTLFGAGLVLAFGLRIGIVLASPAPRIDVYTQFQEASDHLLRGLDPYRTPVSDTPGAGSYGYRVAAYAYPPAGLFPMAAAFALFGDVRYAAIAAEAAAAAALWAIARTAQARAAQLLVLLLLFQPRGLYVIEQAWNEPLLVGAAAAFLFCAARRPGSWRVPVTFGLFLSLKQYLVFFAALFLAPRPRRRLLWPVAGVVLLTWLPFLLWDAPAALDNGLLFQLRTAFRPDGLTVSSLLHRQFGWTLTKGTALLAGSLAAAAAYRALGSASLAAFLYASLLSTLAAFLFGSQAFCNYYSFLGSLLLFLAALRLAPPTAAP